MEYGRSKIHTNVEFTFSNNIIYNLDFLMGFIPFIFVL